MKPLHILLLTSLCVGGPVLGAHLPGGNITYECLGGGQYLVRLTLFRDCDGSELQPQTLNFNSSCGTGFSLPDLSVSQGTEVSQLCPGQLEQSNCNGGVLPGIEVYTVETTVPLGPCSSWVISWEECCRSNSLNLVGNPGTYVEARLNNLAEPCNDSPQFTQSVIPYVCVNEPVNYNLAVTDAENHVLRYRLVNARHQIPPIPVTYSEGNSGQQPYPGMQIDSLTGQISFTPDEIGRIITVVRVDEFADGQWIGSVMRDHMFVVIDCPNAAPDPAAGVLQEVMGDTISSDTMGLTMCTYGGFCFSSLFSDADAGQSLTLNSNVTTVLPGAQLEVNGSNPVEATICWEGNGLEPGNYGFVITAEDDACPTTGLTTYAYTIIILPDSAGECLGTSLSIRTDPVSWSIWPNPANDQLFVRIDGEQAAEVRLYDLLGKQVRDAGLMTGISIVPVADLRPGPYLVRVTIGDRVMEARIMIGDR